MLTFFLLLCPSRSCISICIDSNAEAVIVAVSIFVFSAKAGRFTAALRQATE